MCFCVFFVCFFAVAFFGFKDFSEQMRLKTAKGSAAVVDLDFCVVVFPCSFAGVLTVLEP